MMALLKYRLRFQTLDGRTMVGDLLAFDKHLNVVLGSCEEFHRIKIKDAKPGERRVREEKRVLGLVVLRGEQIVNFTIESPPPAKLADRRGPFVPTGFARPVARGTPLPVAAAAPIAAPGLLGPGKIGGPAPPPGWRPDMVRPGMIPFPPNANRSQ